MIIKRRVFYLLLFFLLNNNSFLYAIDLNAPSIGLGGEQVGKAMSSLVQQIVTSPAGESLVHLFAKSFIPWIPAVMIAGGGLIITKYTLAFVYNFFNNLSKSIDDAKKVPSNVKETKEKVEKIEVKVDDIDTKVENVKTKLENLSIDVKELSNDIEKFRQDFTTKNTSTQEKIFKMDANVLAVNEKIEDVVNRIDQLSETQKITQKNTSEISHKLENMDQENIAQYRETLKQIQKTKTDCEILIYDFATKIEKKDIENMESVLALNQDQKKLLQEIYEFLINIQLRLEDVPQHVIETKDGVENILENQKIVENRLQLNKINQVDNENKEMHVQVIENKGMSGSGIFTTLIRPEFNKLDEKNNKINQELEKIKEENLKREEKLLKENTIILQEVKLLNNSVQQLQSIFQDHYRYNEQMEKELFKYKALFYYSVISNAQKQLEQKNMIAERVVSPQVIRSSTTTSNTVPIGFRPKILSIPSSPKNPIFFNKSTINDSSAD